MTTAQPQPAPFGYGMAKISGVAGALIWLGQLLCGRPSKWQHAFLTLPNGQILEAEVGGARIADVSEYWNGKAYDCAFAYPPMTEAQQKHFALLTQIMVGTPYSFLDYVSLGLLHLHIRPKWVLNRVVGTKSMICSQLVDYVYEQCGIQLFDDGRVPSDVMPADLDDLAKAKGWYR